MLYTLNLFSAVCEFSLNKTGRKEYIRKKVGGFQQFSLDTNKPDMLKYSESVLQFIRTFHKE